MRNIKKYWTIDMNDKPVLIDVRGIFNSAEAIGKGFYYKTL